MLSQGNHAFSWSSPRVRDGALDLPPPQAQIRLPRFQQQGGLAGSGIYLKKSCISDNKLSLCDLRESTWRTVFEFSPQMEKNPLKVLTWTQCIQTGPLAQVNSETEKCCSAVSHSF